MTLQKLLLLSTVCAALNGCASAIVLHPIEQVDIVPMKAGEAYAPVKEGYFLSSVYLQEVLQAKVEQKTR